MGLIEGIGVLDSYYGYLFVQSTNKANLRIRTIHATTDERIHAGHGFISPNSLDTTRLPQYDYKIHYQIYRIEFNRMAAM